MFPPCVELSVFLPSPPWVCLGLGGGSLDFAAPDAGQRKAAASGFPHFATRAAPGENAEMRKMQTFSLSA